MRIETKRRGLRALSVTVLFASLAAATPGIALATPSEDDIARAREAEDAAKMSVAQIEVELASVKTEAELALQKAQSAAEELNGARYALDQATQTARQAQADADTRQGRKKSLPLPRLPTVKAALRSTLLHRTSPPTDCARLKRNKQRSTPSRPRQTSKCKRSQLWSRSPMS